MIHFGISDGKSLKHEEVFHRSEQQAVVKVVGAMHEYDQMKPMPRMAGFSLGKSPGIYLAIWICLSGCGSELIDTSC